MRPPAQLSPAGVVRWLLSAPIVLYQRVVSPGLPRRCKYEPTCSRYAVRALAEYGAGRGFVLAVWRVLRCNPWSHGGYDPVQSQRLFKVREPGSSKRPPRPPDRSAGALR